MMRFEIDASILRDAVVAVEGAAERKSTLPILTMMLLRLEGNALTVTATDLDVEAAQTLAVSGVEDGAVCAPASELAKVLRRMRGLATVWIEEGRLLIKAGRSQVKLPTLPATDFALMARGKGDNDAVLTFGAEALHAALSTVAHAVSREETRYYLNGVYIEPGEDVTLFTATDGHRLGHVQMAGGADTKGIIYPRKTLVHLMAMCVRAKDGDVTLTFVDASAGGFANIVRANAGAETLSSKVIDGNYPDYGRVIPKEDGANISGFDPEKLKIAVETVMSGSGERTSSVKFERGASGLRLSLNETDFSAEAEIDAEVSEGLQPFGINGKYVLDALAAVGDGALRWTVADSMSPTRLGVVSGDGVEDTTQRIVMMPLRV